MGVNLRRGGGAVQREKHTSEKELRGTRFLSGPSEMGKLSPRGKMEEEELSRCRGNALG